MGTSRPHHALRRTTCAAAADPSTCRPARQDAFALLSQTRSAAAQEAGRFDAEIVPLDTTKLVQDKATGEVRREQFTLTADEGNRPGTTLDGLGTLKAVLPDGTAGAVSTVTAGNSSQLSDGASASALMEAAEAERRGLEPLGAYRGMAVAGCGPDEMGIGRCSRSPSS
ncbi:thiolase family protein [Streptomyces sp. NPDC055400]